MDYEAKLLTKLKTRKPDYEWSIEDVEIKEQTRRVVVSKYGEKESGMVLPPNPEWKSIKVIVDTIISNANVELLTSEEWDAIEPVGSEAIEARYKNLVVKMNNGVVDVESPKGKSVSFQLDGVKTLEDFLTETHKNKFLRNRLDYFSDNGTMEGF